MWIQKNILACVIQTFLDHPSPISYLIQHTCFTLLHYHSESACAPIRSNLKLTRPASLRLFCVPPHYTRLRPNSSAWVSFSDSSRSNADLKLHAPFSSLIHTSVARTQYPRRIFFCVFFSASKCCRTDAAAETNFCYSPYSYWLVKIYIFSLSSIHYVQVTR